MNYQKQIAALDRIDVTKIRERGRVELLDGREYARTDLLIAARELAAKDAEIDRLRAEVASLRRAIWWLYSSTECDGIYVGDECRDIHEEALEVALDRGAEETTPDDYITALVVLSDESAALAPVEVSE